MNDFSEITVVDVTLREGMQFCGLMFSPAERMEILAYQEALAVDITQGGYPPAHVSEGLAVQALIQETRRKSYQIQVAALCRDIPEDAERLITAGLTHFHLHTSIPLEMLAKKQLGAVFQSLDRSVKRIRSKVPKASIDINILDIGKTDDTLLAKCATFVIDTLKADILTLPDTSGFMAPNQFHRKVGVIAGLAAKSRTKIGVHCHNDYGLASANTIMGVLAGANVIEVSALGIGERNGIGDLFVVGDQLKRQGYRLKLKTEAQDIFTDYYQYLNGLCEQQTGISLLTYQTPVFGAAMKTHVAGTHALGEFGIAREEFYFLNVLCGKRLLAKYLARNDIAYLTPDLPEILQAIKDKSVALNQPVSKKTVIDIVRGISHKTIQNH